MYYENTAFDSDIDLRKKALRIEHWRQILHGRRKPNALQRQILHEGRVANLIIFGVIALLAYALY